MVDTPDLKAQNLLAFLRLSLPKSTHDTWHLRS